jgi:hypothetical protein
MRDLCRSAQEVAVTLTCCAGCHSSTHNTAQQGQGLLLYSWSLAMTKQSPLHSTTICKHPLCDTWAQAGQRTHTTYTAHTNQYIHARLPACCLHSSRYTRAAAGANQHHHNPCKPTGDAGQDMANTRNDTTCCQPPECAHHTPGGCLCHKGLQEQQQVTGQYKTSTGCTAEQHFAIELAARLAPAMIMRPHSYLHTPACTCYSTHGSAAGALAVLCCSVQVEGTRGNGQQGNLGSRTWNTSGP